LGGTAAKQGLGVFTLLCALAPALAAQEPGWSYSPLGGEGDRATLGCALGSTPQAYACLAVRCEDDFTVAAYVHTSRPEGDLGEWLVTVDKEERAFVAGASATPYGGRLEGDVDWLLDNLRHGATAYIHPRSGEPLPINSITLSGSLRAITLALAYCAPRASAPEEVVRPNG
jgi:hypothetical protein